MAFKLTMSTSNAAFHCDLDEDDVEGRQHATQMEVANYLDAVSRDLVLGYTSRTIMDVNGNTVGRWELTP